MIVACECLVAVLFDREYLTYRTGMGAKEIATRTTISCHRLTVVTLWHECR